MATDFFLSLSFSLLNGIYWYTSGDAVSFFPPMLFWSWLMDACQMLLEWWFWNFIFVSIKISGVHIETTKQSQLKTLTSLWIILIYQRFIRFAWYDQVNNRIVAMESITDLLIAGWFVNNLSHHFTIHQFLHIARANKINGFAINFTATIFPSRTLLLSHSCKRSAQIFYRAVGCAI